MRYIYQTLQALCLTALVSCVQESGMEYPDGGAPEAALSTVTLQVGTSGSVQTRAYGDDEAAIAGEFMNTLTLFVVDAQGVVEKKINATDSAAFEPVDGGQSGCETDYSTIVTLRNGMKTIYAFSNLEGHNAVGEASSLSEKLAAIQEGSVWDIALDQLVVADPAAKINLTNVFIPMTARQEVSVPVTSGTVRIELVRLVGKIRPVLTNDNGNQVEVTGLSIGNFADRVALFEGETDGEVVQNEQRRYTLDKTVGADPVNLYGENVLTVAGDGGTSVPEIYVNETDGSDPFSVTLIIDGDEMSGRTATTAILRNHYLPLVLGLSNFQLEVTAYVSPIAGYPVPITVTPSLTDNYEATVPEGCVFEIGGKFVLANGNEQQATAWTWSLPTGQNADGTMVVENMAAIPLRGYFTALPQQSVTMDFSVTAPRTKNGTLTLTTEPLKDMDEYNVRTRSLRWTDQPARYELVNLGYNTK